MRSTRVALTTTLAFTVAAGLCVTAVAGTAAAAPAQASLVNANPADFTPQVMNGKVLAIAQVGSTVVLGGSFSSVTSANGASTFSRTNLVAFDATTGAVSTTFHPTPSGVVNALASAGDGRSVFVGGGFTSVDGTTANRVVRLDVTSGARIAGFSAPKISAAVRDLKVVGSRLYISGGFKTVGGQSRGAMASLDAGTGALTGVLNIPFSGVNNGGSTTVDKFDVSPDGSRIMAIGNFASAAGQPRSQIAMLDSSGAAVSLADWSTDAYPNYCASVFNTYMRDLDFSPAGDYFIVSTTGAYGGADSFCDTITRWETDRTGGGQLPTWTNHTGGDTTYAVAATGAAVYIGGHMRWVNNPYAGDSAGAGAVPREGIAALDPRTGLPFTWNPGRARGVGVFDMLATGQGLWVGSDTNRIGGETHRRIALMPIAGGVSITPPTTPTLPGTVLQLGRLGSATDPSVLYRVNAGGPQLLSVDDGPDWAADNTEDSTLRNSGSTLVDGWNQPVTRDPSLPDSDTDRAPVSLFDSERWDPGDAPEMHWDFPVAEGTPLTVRLYFANQCDCTASVGDRVFDVAIDGAAALTGFDMVAQEGDRVGFMRSFDITADADGVDLDFAHQVENPLVNGIEIIDRSASGGGAGAGADDVVRTPLDADETVGTTTTTAGSDRFGRTRGAFIVNGVLYTPWQDGTLKARPISANGTFGSPRTVNLYGSTFATDIPNVTGIVYDISTSRVYYTLAGRSELFWRWFLPQSEVVGSVRYQVDGGALDAANTRGMFLSGGDLYFARSGSGDLYRVPFDGGVGGSATLVDSSRDWAAPGVTLASA